MLGIRLEPDCLSPAYSKDLEQMVLEVFVAGYASSSLAEDPSVNLASMFDR